MTWQTVVASLSMGEYNFFVWSAILFSSMTLVGFHWLSWQAHQRYKRHLRHQHEVDDSKAQTTFRIRESKG